MNQEAEQYLRLFVSHRQDDWPTWLSQAEFSHNNSESSATKQTPFYTVYGQHPRIGTEVIKSSNSHSAEEFVSKLRQVREEAKAALALSREEMQKYADRIRGEAPEYQIGQRVWLDTTNLLINRPSRKLAEKRIGPYPIGKLIGRNAVELRLPRNIKIHPVVNVSRIHPYQEPLSGQTSSAPPPIQIGEEEEYEVEMILDARLRRGNKLQFLVKWKGYTDEHNTWESEEDCAHSKAKIAQFYRKHPSAPKRVQSVSELQFREVPPFTTFPSRRNRLNSDQG
jgi:hypothetical protein